MARKMKKKARRLHAGSCGVVVRRYCFTSLKSGHKYRPCMAGRYSHKSYSSHAPILQKAHVNRCRDRKGRLTFHNRCPRSCGY